MGPSTFNCPKCADFSSENLDSLRIHCQKKHKLSTSDLYTSLFLAEGKTPTCQCGCGETPKFWSLQRGFASFVRGHSSRVANNWGHNKDVQVKSQATRREMHKRGEIKIWNKGETKETNELVAAAGRTQSKNFTPERRLLRSSIMKNSWETCAITPLTGSSHSQWRGGTSALGAMCRSRLYREWSFPKMAAAGFKCTECGAGRDLEVHHDVERFATILQKGIETLGEPGDDWDRKTCFVDWVMWYHTTNDVSGKVLCSTCHERIHQVIPE